MQALDVVASRGGLYQYTLKIGEQRQPVKLGWAGRHQVGNSLLAAAVALEAGLTIDQVAAALGELRPVSSRRMDVFERVDGVTVIDDSYNANPASMAAALRTLAAIGEGRRTFAVLGSMAELGDFEEAGHEEVGRLAAELGVDRVVAVGEQAAPIDRGAKADGQVGRKFGAGDRSGGRRRTAARRVAAGRRRAGQGLPLSHVGRGRLPAARGPLVRAVFVAAFVAFLISLFGTPLAITYFRRLRADQPIRSEGPSTHQGKKGTPTMGGVVFIFATLVAYTGGHIALTTLPSQQLRPTGPTATAIVLLGLFVFTGLLGFLDDYLKVSRRNSDGLNKRGKLIGQALIGVVFGVIALFWGAHRTGRQTIDTVASPKVSWVHDIDWFNITRIGAVLLFVFVVMSMSNAVNLTDGLDGLATGTSILVIGSYMAIAFWQYRHWCADVSYKATYCYDVRDPLEMALISGAAAGALVGFLWWNTSPARIFMGDTGSMALGSLIAGLAMATKTILLLPCSACCSSSSW